MSATTALELKALLHILEKEPANIDVMNALAISYFENYEQKTDKEDFDYFEKAYTLQKTVKSTHNFAWFLYFEWSEIQWRWNESGAIERAMQIQKECLELKPKSYYPYCQYGYMLLEQGQFDAAIPFLSKAYQIEKRRDILHNIGYCHFQMGEFQKAQECFSQSTTDLDIENRSLYNLALAEWELNNTSQVKFIADKLSQKINNNFHETISGYEVGLLYFLLDEFQQASACLLTQGIKGIDLIDWTDLSYSLFQTNYALWRESLHSSIVELQKRYDKIEGNHEVWAEYTATEKEEKLVQIKKEIQLRQEILSKGMNKPIQELKKSVIPECCPCLLFDCKRHENRKDD